MLHCVKDFLGNKRNIYSNITVKKHISFRVWVVKAFYTEPSKSQYSISPLVLVIFKSPTPTVVYATLVTLVITISPLVLVIFCKLWVVKVSSTEPFKISILHNTNGYVCHPSHSGHYHFTSGVGDLLYTNTNGYVQDL